MGQAKNVFNPERWGMGTKPCRREAAALPDTSFQLHAQFSGSSQRDKRLTAESLAVSMSLFGRLLADHRHAEPQESHQAEAPAVVAW
jgi:hypothetical protein